MANAINGDVSRPYWEMKGKTGVDASSSPPYLSYSYHGTWTDEVGDYQRPYLQQYGPGSQTQSDKVGIEVKGKDEVN
jgi:hypothetical protein